MNEQDHNQPSRTSETETNESAPVMDGKKRRSLGGCILKLLLLAVIVIGILAFTQFMLTPEIDPELEVPMEITHTAPSEDSGNSELEGSGETGSTNLVEKDPNVDDKPKLLTEMIDVEQIKAAKHPLEPLMDLAHAGVAYMDENVADYSAKLVSRVRIGRRLGQERIMLVKIRHKKVGSADGELETPSVKSDIGEKKDDADTVVATKLNGSAPFSAYTKFLKPRSMAGREAIWVKGKNEGLIAAHLTGLLNTNTWNVDPLSSQAMSGSRHPIFKIGMKNLIVQMIEYGISDMKHEECEVEIVRGVVVGGHTCTMLKVTHPEFRDHFEYHIAKIYLDDERQIPIGYEGFLWPEKEGDEPPLLERYFYKDIKLNIGLTDADFDTTNKDYDYPNW